MANSKDNISKYATSYVSFDEASGNVYDNIGGYVGTVYNAPNRVQGWNGEGYAMSFNGSNTHVYFQPHRVVPMGTKTIRFKIKPNVIANYQVIMTTIELNTTVNEGLIIYINPLGELCFKKVANGVINEMSSSTTLTGGVWYDVVYQYEEKSDGTCQINTFINNSLEGTLNFSNVEVNQATYSLLLGINHVDSLHAYNGLLDSIEMYNSIVSIIPDKHLVLHSGQYKYHNGTSWQTTTATEANFIQYGHDDLSHITEAQWAELVGDKSVIVWSDFEDKESASIVLERETFTPLDVIGNEYDIVVYDTDTKTQQLELVASPDDQELVSLQDIPLLGVETINKVTVNGTGSGKVGFSIDGGLTNRVFKSGQWIPIVNMNDGNTFDEVNNLTPAQMSLLRGNSNIIRMSFFITHDTVLEDVKIICSFEGSERLASSDLYDTSYDMATKTITYTIKQAGLYSFTYTDVE